SRVFLGEALVGLARFGLVTLSGLPALALLAAGGYFDSVSFGLLLLLPLTWGALTGLGLAVGGAEQPAGGRRGAGGPGARVAACLVVGVRAGEHLRDWLAWLPDDLRWGFLAAFSAFHSNNPFAQLAGWLGGDPWVSWEWTLGLEAGAVAACVLLLSRAAARL